VTTARNCLLAGARVIWRYRPPGRFGQIVKVAAVVANVERDSDRVEIVVARLRAGQWVKQLTRVPARYLDPRTQHVVEVDGPACFIETTRETS
jgi:hypothetical protein